MLSSGLYAQHLKQKRRPICYLGTPLSHPAVRLRCRQARLRCAHHTQEYRKRTFARANALVRFLIRHWIGILKLEAYVLDSGSPNR